MNFQKLNLIPQLLAAVESEGYERPTPVQCKAIPAVLDGRDLLASAQTGTGKTAAFALPILQKLAAERSVYKPGYARALVLTPTRELAVQIHESFITYGKNLRLRTTVVYGGVGYIPQKNKLKGGVDILVATPGRLLDLMGQRSVTLEYADIFVLDEADRMLDMGFINDVRKIIGFLPKERQTLLFSATMPKEVQALAGTILSNPLKVQVASDSSTADNIDQGIYLVEQGGKPALLRHLLSDDAVERVLVFTRTKHGADKVCRGLENYGISAVSIHGNKTQNARKYSLDRFKRGSARVLVATDIASRGIDIDSISHVVNYELPEVPETYIHRIGRTARAGASGTSVSFCEPKERSLLKNIERLIRKHIKVLEMPIIEETEPVVKTSRNPEVKKPEIYQGKKISTGNQASHEKSEPFYKTFTRHKEGRNKRPFRNFRNKQKNTD